MVLFNCLKVLLPNVIYCLVGGMLVASEYLDTRHKEKKLCLICKIDLEKPMLVPIRVSYSTSSDNGY